jgi:hypothetical protein
LANGPWEIWLPCPNIPGMRTRENTATVRRLEAPSARPEDKLRRYVAAREHLDRRRREGTDRFAHLRRMHD